jgi:DNA-binding NarL/FixJ family response regulator
MTATTEKVRILVVDDHEMARRGLEAMLSTTDWATIIGEAGDAETGCRLANEMRPDIVLLDIRMPGMDGLACLDRIRADVPGIAVVIVTLYDDPTYVFEALRRGAAGYLLKDATTSVVISTLRAVADGQISVDPSLLREALSVPMQAETLSGGPRQRAEALSLTPREHEVLSLVAEGQTNKEIGIRLSIAEDTVKKHVQNIIWKLRAADRTQAAILALRLGLLGQDD